MYIDIEKLPWFSKEMQIFRKEVLGPNIPHLNFVIFKNTDPQVQFVVQTWGLAFYAQPYLLWT